MTGRDVVQIAVVAGAMFLSRSAGAASSIVDEGSFGRIEGGLRWHTQYLSYDPKTGAWFDLGRGGVGITVDEARRVAARTGETHLWSDVL